MLQKKLKGRRGIPLYMVRYFPRPFSKGAGRAQDLTRYKILKMDFILKIVISLDILLPSPSDSPAPFKYLNIKYFPFRW